jgi:hypothetical protein
MLSNNFVSIVAEYVPCALVPAGDAARSVCCEDREIRQAFEDAQKIFGFHFCRFDHGGSLISDYREFFG